jgi:cyclase
MYISKRLQAIAVVALSTVALQGQAPVQLAHPLPDTWNLIPVVPGKVYMLPSGTDKSHVANVEIIIGKTGVMVVDTKTSLETGNQIIQIVHDLTPLPITHIIETHSDCDHLNGLVAFPPSVKIIAHQNNLLEQEQILRLATVEVNGGSGLPPVDRMPDTLVAGEKLDTHIDGEHIIFYHFGPGHTNGDLVTYLPDEKVVIAGDLLMDNVSGNPGLPPLDHGLFWKFEKNGSIAGWFKNADGMLALKANAYIPGHGPAAWSKERVRALRADMRSEMDQVDAMAESGKSLDEIEKYFNVDKYPVVGLVPPGPARPCPRGIGYKSGAWQEYHEWMKRKEALKPQ